MFGWQEEEKDRWPVRYPAETPRPSSLQRFERKPPRWMGVGRVDTSEVQKRLLWLLLATEVGMALAAACLLPLAFLNLPVQGEGVVGAVLTEVGHWLGVSSRAAGLILGLSAPILLLTLAFNLWWFRRVRRRGEGSRAE